MEREDDLAHLKRNRKVLANEIKWLRQNIAKSIETRDEFKKKIRALTQK